jgi:hypothetical protein
MKAFGEEYAPDFWEIPPVNYFYRDHSDEELFVEYFAYDPFSEEPFFLFGENDMNSDLDYVLEDDEFLEEGWDNDEQDDLHFDFWIQYDARVDEDLRMDGLYGEKLLF